ncbi:MAG: hypothetical protein ACPGRD_11465, partial [Planktomarina sp.]
LAVAAMFTPAAPYVGPTYAAAGGDNPFIQAATMFGKPGGGNDVSFVPFWMPVAGMLATLFGLLCGLRLTLRAGKRLSTRTLKL